MRSFSQGCALCRPPTDTTDNIASNSAGGLLWLSIGGFHQSFQETTLMLLMTDSEGLTRQLQLTLEKYVKEACILWRLVSCAGFSVPSSQLNPYRSKTPRVLNSSMALQASSESAPPISAKKTVRNSLRECETSFPWYAHPCGPLQPSILSSPQRAIPNGSMLASAQSTTPVR